MGGGRPAELILASSRGVSGVAHVVDSTNRLAKKAKPMNEHEGEKKNQIADNGEMSNTPGFWKRLNEPVGIARKRYHGGKGRNVVTLPALILFLTYYIFQLPKDDVLWDSIILIPTLIGVIWLWFHGLKSLPSKNCNGCGERFWQWVDLCPTCESRNFTNQNDTYLREVLVQSLVWVPFLIAVVLWIAFG